MLIHARHFEIKAGLDTLCSRIYANPVAHDKAFETVSKRTKYGRRSLPLNPHSYNEVSEALEGNTTTHTHFAQHVVEKTLVFRYMQTIDTVVPWSRKFSVNTL